MMAACPAVYRPTTTDSANSVGRRTRDVTSRHDCSEFRGPRPAGWLHAHLVVRLSPSTPCRWTEAGPPSRGPPIATPQVDKLRAISPASSFATLRAFDIELSQRRRIPDGVIQVVPAARDRAEAGQVLKLRAGHSRSSGFLHLAPSMPGSVRERMGATSMITRHVRSLAAPCDVGRDHDDQGDGHFCPTTDTCRPGPWPSSPSASGASSHRRRHGGGSSARARMASSSCPRASLEAEGRHPRLRSRTRSGTSTRRSSGWWTERRRTSTRASTTSRGAFCRGASRPDLRSGRTRWPSSWDASKNSSTTREHADRPRRWRNPRTSTEAWDELIESGLLRRVLAMTELRFSNSMIEAWWRALKHQWLFLNTLDSVATVEKLVKFYVTEHNQRFPHSAFRGQTPDEMYFGKGDDVPDDLESARNAARTERLAVNRSLSCAVCEPTHDSDAA